MQAVKTTPHIKQGKGATLVLRTVKLLHRRIFMVLANPAYYLYAS